MAMSISGSGDGSGTYENPPAVPGYDDLEVATLELDHDVGSGDLTGGTQDTFFRSVEVQLFDDNLQRDELAELIGWKIRTARLRIIPEGGSGTTPGEVSQEIAVSIDVGNTTSVFPDPDVGSANETMQVTVGYDTEYELTTENLQCAQSFKDTLGGNGGQGKNSDEHDGSSEMWYRDFAAHGPVLDRVTEDALVGSRIQAAQVDTESIQSEFMMDLYFNVFDQA